MGLAATLVSLKLDKLEEATNQARCFMQPERAQLELRSTMYPFTIALWNGAWHFPLAPYNISLAPHAQLPQLT